MTLAAEDITYIKAHIGEWLAEESLGKPPKVYELELRERSLRIEEQLKHQRDLIQTIIEQNDKRFDALQRQLDQRFEAVDKRFEAMQNQLDQRFEAMQIQLDKRFDAVDKRFEAMDKRFEALTRRIDRFMFWSLGLTISVAGLIIAVMRLWPSSP